MCTKGYQNQKNVVPGVDATIAGNLNENNMV